ncbi:MAG: hypothetical protein AAGG75_13630 [Bacteroidota bacterium]
MWCFKSVDGWRLWRWGWTMDGFLGGTCGAFVDVRLPGGRVDGFFGTPAVRG